MVDQHLCQPVSAFDSDLFRVGRLDSDRPGRGEPGLGAGRWTAHRPRRFHRLAEARHRRECTRGEPLGPAKFGAAFLRTNLLTTILDYACAIMICSVEVMCRAEPRQ